MQILVLTNFYPPSFSWGYTQLCSEVSALLKNRGHRIRVLTTNYGHGEAADPENHVYRRLHLECDPFNYDPLAFLLYYSRHLQENEAAFIEVVKDFRPDLIFVWGMWNMSKRLPLLAEKMETTKVVYYLSDHWPTLPCPHLTYWREPAQRWHRRPVKKVLGQLALARLRKHGEPPRLRFKNAMCVSRALRDSLVSQGVAVSKAHIVFNGIDVRAFSGRSRHPRGRDDPLRLLYAGRLSQDKGVHTALDAVTKLVREQGIDKFKFTIVGDGHSEYKRFLSEKSAAAGLECYVEFRPRVPRDQVPKLLAEFDVLLFPSISFEALPRIPMEALASGLLVVGTLTGGTREVLRDGETGLAFTPGDADGLAKQLNRIIDNPELRRRLTQAGKDLVNRRFTMDRMARDIEDYLYHVVDDGDANRLGNS